MAIVVPNVESVNTLPFEVSEEQRLVIQVLLGVLAQYPDSRILLWATVFVLQHIGIRQKDLARWVGCSDRNLRYINQAVRTCRRGDGKTGRPRQAKGTPPAAEEASIGYSAYAGLWLLVPMILDSRLLQFTALLTFAGPMVGLVPWQWVLTVMALAWLGFSRPQHLDDLPACAGTADRCDVGIALFTGRRTVLDAARARQGMKAIPVEAGEAFYDATAQAEWEAVEHPQPWVSIDEHTVGHQGGPDMPQSRVPRFGRIRRAHQLFGTFVLGARRCVGLVVTQANQKLCHMAADQLRQARRHQQQAQPEARGLRGILDRGSYKGSTHAALQGLKEEGVTYLALARRTQNNVKYWDSLVCTGQVALLPCVHHHDLVLPPEMRREHLFLATCQTPVPVDEQMVRLPTILLIDESKLFDEDAKAKYAAVFFGNLKQTPGLQAQVYPTRQEHELAYRDLIHALGFDALPKGYYKRFPGKKLADPEQETILDTKDIFLVTWLRMLAYNRVVDFLSHLPDKYHRLTVLTAARKFIRRPGVLLIENDRLTVRLDPFPHSSALADYLAWVNQHQLSIPWLSGLVLCIEIAHQPAARTIPPAEWRKLLSAPT